MSGMFLTLVALLLRENRSIQFATEGHFALSPRIPESNCGMGRYPVSKALITVNSLRSRDPQGLLVA